MNQIEIKKYDFIDALRGWAIFAVIISHVGKVIKPNNEVLNLIASQGVQGVGLFFVASALTLFLSMSARNKKEDKAVLKYFIRRFFRIAPLFYFGIIIYTIIKGLDPSFYAPYGIDFYHFFLTVTFLHGWVPDTINAIVPGGWSIATEMMFYLIVPFLHSKLKSPKITISLLLITIISAKIINVLSWTFFNSYFVHGQDLVYAFQNWWLISQLPVFLIGILLFQTIKYINIKSIDKQYGLILLLVSIFLLLSFLKTKTYFDLITSYYFYAFAFFIFALSLYIYPNMLFVNRITKQLGKYSYSLYLTHFAVIMIVENFFMEKISLSGDIGFVTGCLIVTIGSLIISFFTYRFIEKPGINLGRLLISNFK